MLCSIHGMLKVNYARFWERGGVGWLVGLVALF